MSRLITSGAEANTFSSGASIALDAFSNSGSPAIVTSPVRTGTYAWQVGSNNSISFITPAAVDGRTYYGRWYVYITAAPTAAEGLVSVGTFGASSTYNVLLNAGLTLQLRFSSTNIGSASSALSLNTWYRVELMWKNTSGSNDDSGELRLDGLTVASETNQTRGTSTTSQILVGNQSAGNGATWYVDDVAINDDQGASQNTWPGDGKEVLLLPISDNAVGTGWTLGTGTAIASNGFGSVDNTPPTGVADLAAGSDPKQIRNANSTANTNYDANLTTYFNAGIGPNSVINVLDPIVATAAPVTTSSKQGTVGITSNPVIANIALGAGGTAGAFWSGATAGTYATGWKISHGTITYAPAVTVGSSPVMRITQVTASTRIAMVCFMGMYVDYTPGALGEIRSVNQTINRASSY